MTILLAGLLCIAPLLAFIALAAALSVLVAGVLGTGERRDARDRNQAHPWRDVR